MTSPAARVGGVARSAAAWLGSRSLLAVRALSGGGGRWARWLARRWRASLQFRVVAVTVVLSLLVMSLLQTFLYQRIADGLVADRMASSQVESLEGAGEIQSKLDTTDKVDVDSIRQLSFDLIQSQQSQRGESTRELILKRALRNSVRGVALPTLETGIDQDVVPQDVRERLAEDPTHQQVKIISVPRGEGSASAVLVGSIVRVPEAGPYELYYVYPMDRQEQILAMVERTFLLGVVIFAVLVGLIAHVVTRLVVDPVREAAVVAGRLASGRLNERLDVKGEDDLAKLAMAFNGMADSLQAHISRLEDLSAVQQRFVSDVSHELRTPLTTIRMAVDVIYDDRSHFPPISARSTEILYGEVDRFEALLSDLLEISRFDAGAADLERDTVDLRDVVERVILGVAELTRHKGSTITVVAGEEPVRAEMDARRVERIVRNLVTNALEHGEGRAIRIELGSNDAAVAVAVRDFGVGLRPGESDLVFTRFWRADPARKRTTGGTGLGLAIALEDARLHDGWLQAWGEPGSGSRFRLTLPRVAGRPIGYSPLPLTDPAPDELREDGVPVGEPILPAEATPEPEAAELVRTDPEPVDLEPAKSGAAHEPGAELRSAEADGAFGSGRALPGATRTPGGAGTEGGSVDGAADAPPAAIGPHAPTTPPGSPHGSEQTDDDEIDDDEIDDLDAVPPPEELARLEGLADLEEHARARHAADPGRSS